MMDRELSGEYSVRSRDLGIQREQWERQIADLELDVAGFPGDLFDDASRTDIIPTPDDKMVAVFLLGNFRPTLGEEPRPTRLYVGIDQDAPEFSLYEYGPSRVTLDKNGNLIGDNLVALRELSLRTLVPDEIETAQRLLWESSRPTA
jgi:hypothetical protein